MGLIIITVPRPAPEDLNILVLQELGSFIGPAPRDPRFRRHPRRQQTHLTSGAVTIMAGFDAAAADESPTPTNEIKSLLHAIAGQIADADRRHSHVLKDVHDRLSTLGKTAEDVRARVPDDCIAVFDRIESGMAELAGRLHSTEAGRTTARADRSTMTSAIDHAAPAVLKSASSFSLTNGQPRAADPVKLSAGVVDPFDLVGDRAADEANEPWDDLSAEALTKVYEESDAALIRISPVSDAPSPQAAPVRAVETVVQKAPAAPVYDHAADRAWLDDRLSDIALRIEQSLSEVRPDGSVMALGERFDDFEQRVGSVLGDVVTRSDIEGLKLLEAQISELAGHIEQAEAQLGRLDGIEYQLGAVIEQLSDQRLSQLVDSNVRPTEDLEQIAVAAAEHAASRFAGTMHNGQDDGRLAGIGDMLRTMMDERRQGEEQTYSMLDTVQQAMIRVLDRVDALEVSHARVAEITAQGAQRAVAASPVSNAAESAPAKPAPAVQTTSAFDSHEDYDDAPLAAEAEAPSARPTRSSIDKMRQDFVADAQRAKARAAAEQDATISIKPRATGAADMQAAEPQAKRRDPIAIESAPAAKNGGSRKLMFTALALGLVIAASGGSLLMSKKPSGSGVVPVTAAPSEMPIKSDVQAKAETAPVSPVTAPLVERATAAPSMPDNAMPGVEADDVPPPAGMPIKQKAPAAAQNVEPQRQSDAVEGGLTPVKPQAASPVQKSPVAKPPVKKHSIPEMSEDGIGSSIEVPDGEYIEQKNGANTAEPPVTPEGIVLQRSDNMPSVYAIAHLQQQQQLATLSNAIGSAAAKLTPAALMPEETAKHTRQASIATSNTSEIEQSVQRSAPQTSGLSLPPATVGPLSLRTAAAKGDPSAEFEVGARLAEGKGTTQNFKEAHVWYQRAASQGFAQAQYRLGTLFERGLGVKADAGRARSWYQRAAEQGNVKAMHNLAVLSANREGGTPDYTTAAEWFGKAAEFGLADSQFNLAVLHENGLGVAKDAKLAYKWYALAARSGDQESTKRREAAKAALPAGDLEAAEQQIGAYSAKRSNMMANDARTAGEDWKKRQADEDNG